MILGIESMLKNELAERATDIGFTMLKRFSTKSKILYMGCLEVELLLVSICIPSKNIYKESMV